MKQLLLIILFPFILFGQSQIGQDIDGEAIGDNYGNQVSMSSNGNIIAVLGHPLANNGNVRVYYNDNGTWSLYGLNSEGNHFNSYSALGVTLSGDGTTLAIGDSGSTKIFTYESGVWNQKGNAVSNSTGTNDFGSALSLSFDGNTIAISTPSFISASTSINLNSTKSAMIPPPMNFGIVQIFNYEAGVWTQVGNYISGSHNEQSGNTITLSSDGSTIAISNKKSIRVYENISDNWSLKGSEILGVYFEIKCTSLSGDGNTVVIGDSQFSESLIQRGRVAVYEYQSNDWSQLGNDILGEVAYYKTGTSASISSDGQVLAVGEIGSTSGSTDTGRTRIFRYESGMWSQIGTSIFGEGSGDYSGRSVSLSSDASTVAIGAPDNDGNGEDSGHIRVYDLSSTLSSNEFVLSKFSLFPNPTKDEFTIQLQEGIELKKVTIYNSLGQFISSTQKNIVKTSELSTGIYYVEIVTNLGKATKKIVIK